jgi:hypothetical protein
MKDSEISNSQVAALTVEKCQERTHEQEAGGKFHDGG